ncbi:MAG: glycosyltransferase family 9 protein [Pirellulales bacterium]
MRLFSPDHLTPAPERILLVRLSAIGDVIHGLPALNALRDAFPRAFITWIVEGRSAELLEGHPALDQVVLLPRGWWRSLTQVRQLRRKLREYRFDTTVDLQCLTKSALVAWLSGAPRRLGAAGRNGRELSKWFNNVLTPVAARHVIEHYLGLLEPLGISSPQVRFDLPEREDEADFAAETLEDMGLALGKFVVLNPGAGWPSKLWPAERYGALAQQLARHHGLASLALWGGADELPLAERIVDSSGGHAVLAPATSLRQLAAVTRRAALFVGSDTGPMHLAVAVGVPTVSLHGVSRAEWCGAYGTNNVRLQAYYDDGSSRKRRTADNLAMRAITVDMVSRACSEALARSAGIVYSGARYARAVT